MQGKSRCARADLLPYEDEIRNAERSEVDAALRPSGYAEGMLSGWDLDSTDPLKRDLA